MEARMQRKFVKRAAEVEPYVVRSKTETNRFGRVPRPWHKVRKGGTTTLCRKTVNPGWERQESLPEGTEESLICVGCFTAEGAYYRSGTAVMPGRLETR